MGKRIAIFGGSFNPPHDGHVGLVRYALQTKKIDAVWVIPCWRHPFAKALAPFPDRLRMCRIAFRRFQKRVVVKDLERRLEGTSYTIRTLRHCQSCFPKVRFVLLVGADVAREARQWRGYSSLRKEAEWLIAPRGAASPIVNVSATEIRRRLKQKKNLKMLLSKNVVEYVERHRLYGVAKKGGV